MLNSERERNHGTRKIMRRRFPRAEGWGSKKGWLRGLELKPTARDRTKQRGGAVQSCGASANGKREGTVKPSREQELLLTGLSGKRQGQNEG